MMDLAITKSDQLSIDWRVGEKLLTAIKRYDDQLLEATCGGQASCSTCHVYLRRASNEEKDEEDAGISIIDMLPLPDDNELDLIDLAYQPNLDGMVSRLSCQIRLTPAIIDAAVTNTAAAAAAGGDGSIDRDDNGISNNNPTRIASSTAASAAQASPKLTVQIPNGTHNLWDV